VDLFAEFFSCLLFLFEDILLYFLLVHKYRNEYLAAAAICILFFLVSAIFSQYIFFFERKHSVGEHVNYKESYSSVHNAIRIEILLTKGNILRFLFFRKEKLGCLNVQLLGISPILSAKPAFL